MRRGLPLSPLLTKSSDLLSPASGTEDTAAASKVEGLFLLLRAQQWALEGDGGGGGERSACALGNGEEVKGRALSSPLSLFLGLRWGKKEDHPRCRGGGRGGTSHVVAAAAPVLYPRGRKASSGGPEGGRDGRGEFESEEEAVARDVGGVGG